MSNDCNTCDTCAVHNQSNLISLGVKMDDFDYLVALAGNPNTGKSTIFNNLTGLRQHTGNWPGKTVTRAEGAYFYGKAPYKVVDLPGTYSLLSTSTDEEVARDFILFGQPDVTVIVVDATRLARNLNLVLQILEITDRAVLCLNLMDEAQRNNIQIDTRTLSKSLGIPVVAAVAREKKGQKELLQQIEQVATGKFICKPKKITSLSKKEKTAIGTIREAIDQAFPTMNNTHWVAMRLLEGDKSIVEAIQTSKLLDASLPPPSGEITEGILTLANQLRWQLGDDFHDKITEAIYAEAKSIASKCTKTPDKKPAFSLDRKIDQIVTSKWLGFPIMFLILALVFWVTIEGANYPSAMLATLLVENGHPLLKGMAESINMPWWLSGVLIDGAYLAMAWVIAVMLPPMAIFFPIFTLLEDFGYLPRVAFNMDSLFKKAGAHGKQALTMSMGFGCNAAGVVATRIIDSPRERLLAIITNNFSLCNGRWPTQILLASIFIGSMVPSGWAAFVTAGAVIGVAVLGIFLSLVVSWGLSNTILKGEASSFSLELPPYRPPQILQTLYTSLIDRTLIVLWRAIIFAVPAGILIWLVSNINIADTSLAEYFISWSNPIAWLFGLNGVILLAYILAIPANEIVIPTILMLTVLSSQMLGMGAGSGVMFELDSANGIKDILVAGGWTALTAVSVMIFSLLHNPCSTTIYTIYKETKSLKWTLVSTLLPLGMGFVFCFFIAQIWRLVG